MNAPQLSRSDLLRALLPVANALAIDHLAAFVRLAWPILNPGRPLKWGWHMDAMCLPADAQLQTRTGPREIRSIVESEERIEVLSFNHATSRPEWREVLTKMKSPGKPLVEIATASGKKLVATDDHPVFVVGVGYIPAGEVRVGQRIVETQALVADPVLQALRSAVSPKPVPDPRRVLRDEVLWGGEEEAGDEDLPYLRRPQGSRREEALSGVLRKIPAHRSDADLCAVQDRVLPASRQGEAGKAELLQSRLSRQIHDRIGQSGVHQRFVSEDLPKGLQVGAQGGVEEGWFPLLPVRRERENGRPPHRLEQVEQRRKQPRGPVPSLPRAAAGGPGGDSGCLEGIVVSVERSLRVPVAVYNVEVDGNNNYFANGVLVHNCDHLEAVTDRRIKKIVINLPPGLTKTTIVTICWPVWVWLKYPERRFITASYADDLARKASKDRGDLIRSTWYQELIQQVHERYDLPKWRVSHDTQKEIENTRSGFMLATSVDGQGTGRHADHIIVDDPIKAKDIYTVKLIQHVTWFRETLRSRVTDVQDCSYVIVMQRLHDDELSGVLIKDPTWDHLRLPAEYNPDPKKQSRSSIGWKDPRTEDGEPLFPARFPKHYLEEQKGPFGLGPIAFAAQQNQDPIAGLGNVFQRNWWRFWTDDPNARIPQTERVPEEMDELVGSWDMSFKAAIDSGFVVGQMWGRKGADFYLLDQVRARLGFGDTRTAFRNMRDRWPECTRWLVEEKANGAAIIDELKSEIPGIIPVVPTESKEARAAAVSSYVQSGNVYVPSPQMIYLGSGEPRYPWVGQFLDEASAFPQSTLKDQVDTFTQAIRDMSYRLKRAMGWTLPEPLKNNVSKPRGRQLDLLKDTAAEREKTFEELRITAYRKLRKMQLPAGLPSATWDPTE